VHLGRATIDRFLTAREDLLVAHQVALWVAQVAAERAKDTPVHAHIRGIEVRVDIVPG
jgi:hypothetical protein